MDPMLILQNIHTGVLKEPRGFIKILQLLFTICAYGTTTSFFTSMKVSAPCAENVTESVEVFIQYNFKFNHKYTLCGKTFNVLSDFSSDSGFFVAVGVLASLFVVAVLLVYLFMNPKYEASRTFPLADCVGHGIFTILFLAASSAWANSLTALKTFTSQDTINAEQMDICKGHCNITEEPNYAKLNISIILGFLNVFLFGSNLWFLYKETALQKDKQEPQPDIEPTIN